MSGTETTKPTGSSGRPDGDAPDGRPWPPPGPDTNWWRDGSVSRPKGSVRREALTDDPDPRVASPTTSRVESSTTPRVVSPPPPVIAAAPASGRYVGPTVGVPTDRGGATQRPVEVGPRGTLDTPTHHRDDVVARAHDRGTLDTPTHHPHGVATPAHDRGTLDTPTHHPHRVATPAHDRGTLDTPTQHPDSVVTPAHDRGMLDTPTHHPDSVVTPVHDQGMLDTPTHQDDAPTTADPLWDAPATVPGTNPGRPAPRRSGQREDLPRPANPETPAATAEPTGWSPRPTDDPEVADPNAPGALTRAVDAALRAYAGDRPRATDDATVRAAMARAAMNQSGRATIAARPSVPTVRTPSSADTPPVAPAQATAPDDAAERTVPDGVPVMANAITAGAAGSDSAGVGIGETAATARPATIRSADDRPTPAEPDRGSGGPPPTTGPAQTANAITADRSTTGPAQTTNAITTDRSTTGPAQTTNAITADRPTTGPESPAETAAVTTESPITGPAETPDVTTADTPDQVAGTADTAETADADPTNPTDPPTTTPTTRPAAHRAMPAIASPSDSEARSAAARQAASHRALSAAPAPRPPMPENRAEPDARPGPEKRSHARPEREPTGNHATGDIIGPIPERQPARRRTRVRKTRRPAVGLIGLVVFAFAGAFFAWFAAGPLWLTLGHSHTGTALVANCRVGGIDRRCADFTASDRTFTARVTLLAATEAEPGTMLPARMVSPSASVAYVGDPAPRWISGILLTILCGLGIAWSTGASRLPDKRARRLAALVSVAGPLLVLAGMLAAAW